MRLLFYTSILLLAACANHTSPTKPRDSLATTGPAGLQARPRSYVPIKKADIGNYLVSVQAVFWRQLTTHHQDSLGGNVLIAYNKATKKADTLELNGIDYMPNFSADLKIEDVTRDIAFDRLAVIIGWEGDSDNWYSSLIGYVDDTLRTIYEDPNPGGIEKLKRKDRWTLTGFSWGSEDITHESTPDYPLTISLKTFEGEIKTPDTVMPHFLTEATDTINAFRIHENRYTPYIILPGVGFEIDTVLTKSGTTIMHTKDSVILRTTGQRLEGKMKFSDAG